MKKHVLIFGALPGLIWLILQLIVAHQMYTNPNLQPNDALGYTIMVVIFSLIFFGVRDYRNRELDGTITFGNALKTGILMILVTTAVYVIVWMFYYYLFIPDFLDVYSQFVLENDLMEADMLESLMAWYRNPAGMAILTALEVMPMGLLAALVSALILKKKKQKVVEGS